MKRATVRVKVRPKIHLGGDHLAGVLWKELKRLACEDAITRQLRHDKATARHHYPKNYGPFGEEK